MRTLLVCLSVGVIGCGNDPGSLSKGEVEDKLKAELKLKSLTLAPLPEGGFEGTGDRADGRTVKITVTQKPEERSLWYSAKDEKGEFRAGGFKSFAVGGIEPRALRWVKLGALVLLGVGAIAYAIWKGRYTHSDEGAG